MVVVVVGGLVTIIVSLLSYLFAFMVADVAAVGLNIFLLLLVTWSTLVAALWLPLFCFH